MPTATITGKTMTASVKTTPTSRPGQANMLVDRFETDRAEIETQLERAIQAIQQYAEKKEAELVSASGAKELLADPESFTLSFTLNRIPAKKDYRFVSVELPHAIVDPSSKSVCLLVKDPKEAAVAAVKANELPVEKVIAVKSLKRKYASHDGRRALGNRFDLFFCQEEIFELMGTLLGKFFFETKKSKIPSPLKSLSKAAFDRALRTSRFRVRGGAVIGIKIGHRGMSVAEVVANGMAATEFIAAQYCSAKKTWNNVSNVTVSATNVIGLPIWSVPVREEMEEPVEKSKKVVKSAQPLETALESAAEPTVVPDLSSVPVKQLKAVQKQRVAAARAQLEQKPKKPRNK